jgi:hypothetical protein
VIIPPEQETGPAREGSFQDWWIWVLLAGTAVALRAAHLDQPLRTDEATTFLVIQGRSWWELLAAYTPNNHLLHSCLVKLSMAILGADHWGLRLPAFLAGCALIPSLGRIVGRIYGPATALLTASLAATSAWLTAYSTDARGYSLAGLFWAWALYWAWKAVRTGRENWLFGAGLWGGLAVASVLSQLWPLAGLALALTLSRESEGNRLVFKPARGIRVLAGALVSGAVWYLPAIIEHGLSPIIANEHLVRVGLMAAARSAAFQVLEVAGYALPTLGPGLLGLALTGLAGLVLLKGGLDRILVFIIFLGGWSFGIEILQGVRAPAWTFIYLIPLIHLVWVRALFTVAPGLDKGQRFSKAAAGLGLGLALALSILIVSRGIVESSGPGRFPEARGVADFLVDRARIDPADRIVALSPDQQPLLYYLWQRGATEPLDLAKGKLKGRRVFIVETGSNPYPNLARAWPELEAEKPRLLYTQDQTKVWVMEREAAQALKHLDHRIRPG